MIFFFFVIRLSFRGWCSACLLHVLFFSWHHPVCTKKYWCFAASMLVNANTSSNIFFHVKIGRDAKWKTREREWEILTLKSVQRFRIFSFFKSYLLLLFGRYSTAFSTYSFSVLFKSYFPSFHIINSQAKREYTLNVHK